MGRRASCLLASTLLIACGDDGPGPTPETTLAASYDAAGVLRVLEDGIDPIALLPVYFLFEDLAVEDGQLTGSIRAKGGEAHAISGELDEETNDAIFLPFSGALTGTVTEQIQELGFRGEDGRPVDGVLDDAPGFFRSTDGVLVRSGSFFGVSRGPTRPARPDETKIRAVEAEVGEVTITADPGAFEPGVGVELFRYRLVDPLPLQTSDLARDDGSFAIVIGGFAGEAFLIRSVRAGVASDGRVVPVTQP